jgi:hypothetical protein
VSSYWWRESSECVSSSQVLVNQGNVANLWTGESHVLIAAGAVFVIGAAIILWGWNGSNSTLLLTGVVLLVLAAGMSVDIWSHGFSH